MAPYRFVYGAVRDPGASFLNTIDPTPKPSTQVAFWNSLADDLRLDPPCYVRVVRVIGEIRDGIHDLASGGGAWKGAAEIADVLDIELIQQQVDAGGFDWASCIKLIHDVKYILNQFRGGVEPCEGAASGSPMKATWEDVGWEMEASAGDTTKQPDAFCRALEFLLDRTKAVRIEVANSRLRLISPVIKDHGVEYERNHMDKKLREGGLSLTRTRTWLREAIYAEVCTGRLNLCDLTTRDHTKSASYISVLNAGVVALLTGAKPPRVAACPETLLLDVTRLAGMHAAFRLQVLTASVLVIVGQRLGELREKNPVVILDAIAERIIASAPRAGDLASVVATVCEELEASCEMSQADLKGLAAVLMKGVEANRPVPKLMETRLRNVLLRGMNGGAVDMFKDVAGVAV